MTITQKEINKAIKKWTKHRAEFRTTKRIAENLKKGLERCDRIHDHYFNHSRIMAINL